MLGIRNWLNQPAHVFVLIACLIPLAVLLWFVWVFGRAAYPISDTYTFGLPVALSTFDGTLGIQDLFEHGNGHRTVTYHFIVWLSTQFTAWDTRLEILLNVALGVVNLGLLVWLFAADFPHLTHLILFPFALVMLSVDYGMTWLVGIFVVWHLILFANLAILHLLRWRFFHSAVSLVICVLLAAGAALSMSHGIMAFAILIVGMVVYGYRFGWGYVFVIAAASILVGWHLIPMLRSGEGTALVTATPPGVLVAYVLTLLGRPLALPEAYRTAQILGGVGAVVFGLNFVGALWLKVAWRKLMLWLLLSGYAVGFALIVAFTRYEPDLGMTTAAFERYTQTTALAWLALVAVMVVTMAALLSSASSWKHWLAYLDGVVLAGLSLAYGIALAGGALLLEYGEPAILIRENAICTSNYPITQDASCLNQTDALGVNQLAARRLSGFARKVPSMKLVDYTVGEPVIVDVGGAWAGLGVRDWLLRDVPDVDVIHIAPETDTEAELAAIPRPMLRRLTHLSDVEVASDVIWLVQRGDDSDCIDPYAQTQTAYDRDYDLSYTRCERDR